MRPIASRAHARRAQRQCSSSRFSTRSWSTVRSTTRRPPISKSPSRSSHRQFLAPSRSARVPSFQVQQRDSTVQWCPSEIAIAPEPEKAVVCDEVRGRAGLPKKRSRWWGNGRSPIHIGKSIVKLVFRRNQPPGKSSTRQAISPFRVLHSILALRTVRSSSFGMEHARSVWLGRID